MVKRILIFLLSSGILLPAYSQRSVTGADELKGVVYAKEFSFGARLNTNGWGLFAERGKILDIKNTRIWQVEFTALKNPRETKQQPTDFYRINSFLDSSKDYFYGKQNSFFAVQGGFGNRRKLAERADKSGVRVSVTYLAGVSLGLLKPYYLEYIDTFYNEGDKTVFLIRQDKYRAGENEEKFLDPIRITGSAGFKQGFGEISLIPGGYGKLGLNFDWASKDELVKALEAGISGQFYYKKIPVMIRSDNSPYFLAAYVSFQFGKRSYR